MRSFCLCFIAFSMLTRAFGGECGSALELTEQLKNDQVHVFLKNRSRTAVVAYVLVGDQKSADGSPVKVFSGVFSPPSKLARGKSIQVDVRLSDSARQNLSIDYVRLANGWTCGNATTEDAKKVVARFEDGRH